jgi:hypothetical protein
MELDSRGIRIEHGQPLKNFLNESPFPPPCELPSPCAPALEQMQENKADEVPSEEDLPVPNLGAKVQVPGPALPVAGEVKVEPL